MLLPLECSKTRGQDNQDFERREGFCWYGVAKFRQLYPEYNDLDDKALGDAIYTKAGMPPKPDHRKRDKVIELSGIVFGLPLGALAIGWALLWAFSGFRSAQKV